MYAFLCDLLKIVATSITGPNSRNFNFGFFFLERKWVQQQPSQIVMETEC